MCVRTCVRADKCADFTGVFLNSFRRNLIHRYYGFLQFRRSLSPKSPRVSVGVRVRIRVRVRARVRVRNRSGVSAI